MLTLVYGDNVELVDEYVKINYTDSGYEGCICTPSSLLFKIQNKGLFDSNTSKPKILYNLEVNQIKDFSEFEILLKVTLGKDFNHLVLVDYSNDLKAKVKKFDNAIAKNISVDENIFKLVDSIFEMNLAKSLSLLEPYLAEQKENYVITMIFYMLKNLLKYYYSPSDFQKLNPYVQSKVSSLAKKTSISKTKNVIFSLSEADYKIKSGGSSRVILSSLLSYLAN